MAEKFTHKKVVYAIDEENEIRSGYVMSVDGDTTFIYTTYGYSLNVQSNHVFTTYEEAETKRDTIHSAQPAREPLIDTRGKTYGETEYAPTPAANSEPQTDITPADRAAVEAMGETEANVFGGDGDEPKFSANDNVVITFEDIRDFDPRDGTIAVVRGVTTRFQEGEWCHFYNVEYPNGNRATFYEASLKPLKLTPSPLMNIDTDTPQPNVLDVPASDEISKQNAQPEGVFEVGDTAYSAVDKSYVVIARDIEDYEDVATVTFEDEGHEINHLRWLKQLELVTPLVNRRAATAQTAPVDGGSDEPDYPTDYTPYVNANPDVVSMDDLPAQFKAQQAEIRTLESKLAAAAAIEQRLLSEWVAWHDSYEKVIGHYIPTEIVNQMKMLERILGYTPDREGRKPLAAREQSGAGEG